MGVAEMKVIASLIARAIKDPASSAKIAGEVKDLCRRFPVYPER
jgi:glycine/serine hydroxymethyltransferase